MGHIYFISSALWNMNQSKCAIPHPSQLLHQQLFAHPRVHQSGKAVQIRITKTFRDTSKIEPMPKEYYH